MNLILKILSIFVVRTYSIINGEFTTNSTETKTQGRQTGESPAVISLLRIEWVRSDLPLLFNQNSFIMRTQNDEISPREEAALHKAWLKFIEPTGKQHLVPETQDALFKIIYYLLYYQGLSNEDSNTDVINAIFHLRLLHDFFNDYHNYLTELNQN